MPYSVSVATSREFKQDLRILMRKHGTENFVRTKAATQMHGYKKNCLHVHAAHLNTR